jgi:hypothetical protein
MLTGMNTGINSHLNITETEATRNLLLKALHCSICKVIFTKTDGTERTMLCTLDEQFLPSREESVSLTGTKTGKPRHSPDVLYVWDVEKDDWRAFRVDRVKEWNIEHQRNDENDLLGD